MSIFNLFGERAKTRIDEVRLERISDFSDFKRVADFLYEKSGIVDLDKRVLTSSSLQRYATSRNVHSTSEFISRMKSDPLFYQEVINIATVNETFFMREIKELEWLVDYIADSSKTLKILSMPCSSGEEIYSILLLMSIKNVALGKVEIYGCDINSNAVEKAKKGEYEERSLHKLDERVRNEYFTINEKGRYAVSQNFKNKANFSQKNIFDSLDSEERYDVILSRNMFIYFDDEKRALATKIIANALNTGGLFIKGHADHIYKRSKLEYVRYGVYKKVLENKTL